MNISRFVLLYGLVVIFLILFISRARRRAKPSEFDFGPKRLDQNPHRFKERELNCFFEFRGEKFDAFEVLGVPAGSDNGAVMEAYRKLIGLTEDEPLRARMHAAFDALKKQRGL